MYSWDDDTSDWHKPGSYAFDSTRKEERAKEAKRSKDAGPRSYGTRQPNLQLVDPKKKIYSASKNPLLIAVDVTGSMQRWPSEIFDRLPLLFNTLSQYRADLEICFAAIGDARADRWPLQVTEFARGFDLETQLKAIFGEGGGGDTPESYGLFAHWVNGHVQAPNAGPERPFAIVFGDAPMHPTVPGNQIRGLLGEEQAQDVDAIAAWREVASRFDTWFLRRPGGRSGDETDKQWSEAVGAQQVMQMDSEQRAVDYAMGLVARSWGHFGDFKGNMAARHDAGRVEELERRISAHGPRTVKCPSCSAPLPPESRGRMSCPFCKATIQL